MSVFFLFIHSFIHSFFPSPPPLSPAICLDSSYIPDAKEAATTKMAARLNANRKYFNKDHGPAAKRLEKIRLQQEQQILSGQWHPKENKDKKNNKNKNSASNNDEDNDEQPTEKVYRTPPKSSKHFADNHRKNYRKNNSNQNYSKDF